MRSLTLGVSPLPALALLLALLSPLSAHAQGGGFGLGPAQGTGSSFTGGTLDSQVTWDSGLGAIDHILGPTDQDLVISSPSGRNTILEANGTVNARMTLTTSYVEFTDPIRSPDGSASAPAYSFSSDTNTGIYSPSGDQIGFTVGSVTGPRVTKYTIDGNTTACFALATEESRYVLNAQGDAWLQGATEQTLSDGVATAVFDIDTADGNVYGLVVNYMIEATDGSAMQVEVGQLFISAYDTSGGSAGTLTEANVQQNLSSGTLTTTWAFDASTDDGVHNVTMNANSDLTTPTITVRYWLGGFGATADVEVVPQ